MAIAFVLATLGMAGVFGATAILDRTSMRHDDSDSTQTVTTGAEIIPVSTRTADQSGTVSAGSQPDSVRTARADSTTASTTTEVTSAEVPATAAARTNQAAPVGPAPAPPPPAPAVSSAPLLEPILPLGQSPLRDGIVARRSEGGVKLSFDNSDNRTRLPAKFEQFVRATLPQVYGAPAESALSRIPFGALAKQGDLLTELPVRGMRIPLKSGGAIAVYPETRVGRDGPLVVRYHTTVTR